jgi:transcriptional regulator with GAF, ATPase, and Fis domain
MARYDFPVLLAGESGTGKELFARMIHESSNRQDKEYRVINCGAIPAGLLESELFGHVKGAFTGADADKKGIFEICDGGTLFLDEIGDLPLVLQVKILRVTDRHEQLIRRVGGTKDIPVNVRIIAATNRNLKEMVIKGEFREDLFRRLAVGYLTLPPLRDRIDDLDLLIDHFVKKINQREQERHSGFSSRTLNREAREFLRKRYWSGNVRELEFTLERALLMFARETTVTLEDVEDAYLPLGKDNEDNDLLNSTLTETHNINDVQAELYLHYLKKAIELRGYKQAAIGRELGLKKGTFEKMLRDGAKAEKNGKTPSAIYRLIAKDATASGVINKKDDKK